MKTSRSLLKTLLVVVLAGGLSIPTAAQKKSPLKVYVLVGQSNMQGHARAHTLEHIGMDEKTAPIHTALVAKDGTPKLHDDVFISYLSSNGVKSGKLSTGFGADDGKIGPELAFGVFTQKHVVEPILIIKAAWGGKSLNTDFRPPSAGPYVFNETQLENFKKQGKDLAEIKAAKAEATGHYYRLTVEHVQDTLAKIGDVVPGYTDGHYELAGFVWFQGWNDMVDRGTYPTRDQPGGYDAYTEVMAHFIRDMRRDLDAPEMPFVIGVIGVGGPVSKYGPSQQRYAGVHQNIRDAMAAPAAMPEFKGNVAAVLTENFWDLQLTELKEKEGKARQQAKELKVGRDEERAAFEKFRDEELTAEEQKILEIGISNQAYHYLGSAKILSGIGKAFADAIAEMRDSAE
ncbi:MAG: hypothetical protein HKN23_12285 [Verrucomicrobiales bacterium]|nr:hypothetical protein [Verrucomicrobiales bacterium]